MLLGRLAEAIMTIGEQLRASREAKGLSLDAVSHSTRVQTRYLAAIERNDVASVPPRPFGRGFVRAYAKEIGLDPERTAQDYFAQFAPLQSQAAVPVATTTSSPGSAAIRTASIPAWVALATLAAVVVALGALTLRRSDREAVSPPASTIGTSGRAATPAPVASETRDKVPARDITLATAAPEHPLTVQLTTTRRCWITASADGKRVIYQLLTPGSAQTLTADREIQILAGDAGALEWTINGRNAGVFGPSGQIVTQRVTPESAATIK
jgi:cytoskeleton protein RodZ